MRKFARKNLFITFFENDIVWELLSLKIGKKAKNARGGHIHDTTAFFWETPKNLKNSGVLMKSSGRH